MFDEPNGKLLTQNFSISNFTTREDPNNRSSKDVQHLGPATDFYKRLALDCSGVQIAVDLFLLNSQYSDLATLCEYIKEFSEILWNFQ